VIIRRLGLQFPLQSCSPHTTPYVHQRKTVLTNCLSLGLGFNQLPVPWAYLTARARRKVPVPAPLFIPARDPNKSFFLPRFLDKTSINNPRNTAIIPRLCLRFRFQSCTPHTNPYVHQLKTVLTNCLSLVQPLLHAQLRASSHEICARLTHKPVALPWRQRPSFFPMGLGLPQPRPQCVCG
jgi:hypothetical protein